MSSNSQTGSRRQTISTTSRDAKISLGGRYRLLEQVGQGGTAKVFRARDQRLDRIVAVKILRRQFVHDQASRARFLNEARAAAGLAHPNIVDVYDFGEAPDGSMFIAMQFVEGQNLKDILQRRGRMTAAETVSIVRQVCGALSAAHACGLIHRDVKPQNILIDRTGHARLGDFGIVKAVSGPELTQTWMTFGTATYLSPEQATEEPIGPASDVYALGCVMYEMLSGTPPFTGDNPAVVAYKQVWEQPRPLRDLAPEVPRYLENVVMRCLQKSPRARYLTTDALSTDLSQASASSLSSTVATLMPTHAQDVRSVHRTIDLVKDMVKANSQLAWFQVIVGALGLAFAFLAVIPAWIMSAESDSTSGRQGSLYTKATPTSGTSTAKPLPTISLMPIADPANACRGILSADRLQISSATPCSITIPLGPPVSVTFSDDTLSTMWIGDEFFLASNHRGDRVDHVLAGTFRPLSAGWDIYSVTAIEVQYYEFDNPGCLRDADNGNRSLTSTCDK